ncbi:MAG TPA: hypothetical protein VHX88_13985 [Solirubrobacteraceae bacterium]|jgi:hypothetical protein|nr:hypothetical protein [Solirubrobacteraceae bacterium]
MTGSNPIAERQPITVDDLPWESFVDETGFIPDGPTFKTLMDSGDPEQMFAYFRFPPDYRAPSHWHPSDTIYIIRRGLFIVEGEKPYHPGDVRWVKGGFAYGQETAGPEGCEFFLASLGPFAVCDPDENPPPRGSV